jgi:hypothetical protein
LLPRNFVPEAVSSKYEPLVVFREVKDLDVRLVGDVRPSVVRDWNAVAQLLGEVVEVELTVLEAEISDRTRWHEASLDVACLGVLADEDIALVRELGLQPLLLVLLVRAEGLAHIDLLQLISVLLQEHTLAVASVCDEELVLVNDSDESTGSDVRCLGVASVERRFCDLKGVILALIEGLFDAGYDVPVFLAAFEVLFEVDLHLLGASVSDLPSAMTVVNSHIISFEAMELVAAKSIFNWPVAFKLESIDTTFDQIRFEIAALALVA